MAQLLGKRKRAGEKSAQVAQRDVSPEENEEDLRARFQRAFEAKFKPLPVSKPSQSAGVEDDDDQEDDSDSDDGFGGFSDDEAEDVVEVVEHRNVGDEVDRERIKREQKAFMSARPPSIGQTTTTRKATPKTKADVADDEAESTNLKHDLALQRLLKESHLLDKATVHGSPASLLAPEGKARLKALDLRIQDLGAKKSLNADVKMPMSHRKGISAKATNKETLRRREAAENGIILERAKAKLSGEAGSVQKRREKGIGAPSVGRFKGGTLSLSSKDVRSISSGGGSSAKKGGRGRRK